MNDIPSDLKEPLVALLLSIADDKFIRGHRDADWTGLGPILEEDIAFSSIAQEEIAHASALYDIVASIAGNDADAIAYGRKPEEYRCATLVEQHDEFNWASAIVRQFFTDHLDALRLERLARSNVKPLAALCGRLLAEERVHVDHADTWIQHLGNGGDDARKRVQGAFAQLAQPAAMLFEVVPGEQQLASSGVYPELDGDMFNRWSAGLNHVAGDAGFTLSIQRPPADAVGGRRGKHSDGFAELLDEMCEVYRVEPEAKW